MTEFPRFCLFITRIVTAEQEWTVTPMPSEFPMWHHFTLTATKTPCYQCDRRTPGCHGSCEEYQAFSAERQEVYRQRMTYSAATRGRWRKELAKKPR